MTAGERKLRAALVVARDQLETALRLSGEENAVIGGILAPIDAALFQSPGPTEREQIVAWLRDLAAYRRSGQPYVGLESQASALDEAADAVERGEHLKVRP
jgi:hypothetical protein